MSQYLFLLLIFTGPPILECADPTPPDISGGFVNLPFGCDLCLERGQSVFLVTLACQPITNRQPTNCTIRNPDGETAQDLDDGDTYSLMGNTLAVSNGVFANPEDPLPPTVLGDWTCTCINRDGMATAVSKIGSCCKLDYCCCINSCVIYIPTIFCSASAYY